MRLKARRGSEQYQALVGDEATGTAGPQAVTGVPPFSSPVCIFRASFMNDVEKCLELAGARGLAQLAQGPGFDLANALAGDGERAANLLQRILRAILQT